jgi:hypothetical protein
MFSPENISEKFPFLTGLRVQSREFIGIVQNSDEKIISFYNYDSIRTTEERLLFLEHGETWWWESNRLLPINIFMQGQMTPFRYCLKTAVNKDIEVLFGPMTSLNNIMKKRIKKRQIQLIRKKD